MKENTERSKKNKKRPRIIEIPETVQSEIVDLKRVPLNQVSLDLSKITKQYHKTIKHIRKEKEVVTSDPQLREDPLIKQQLEKFEEVNNNYSILRQENRENLQAVRAIRNFLHALRSKRDLQPKNEEINLPIEPSQKTPLINEKQPNKTFTAEEKDYYEQIGSLFNQVKEKTMDTFRAIGELQFNDTQDNLSISVSEDYMRKYALLNEEQLYEVMIAEKKDYHIKVDKLLEQFNETTNLIVKRKEEIEALRNLDKYTTQPNSERPTIVNYKYQLEALEKIYEASIDKSSAFELAKAPKVLEEKYIPSTSTPSENSAQMMEENLLGKENLLVQSLREHHTLLGEMKKKYPFVMKKESVESLYKAHESLLAQIQKVKESKERDINNLEDPKAYLQQSALQLETGRLATQIDYTTAVIDKLRTLKTSLTENLAKLYIAIKEAEENRRSVINDSSKTLRNKVAALKAQVDIIENKKYEGYIPDISGIKKQINDLSEGVETNIEKFESQDVLLTEKAYNELNKFLDEKTSLWKLTQQIEKADYYILKKKLDNLQALIVGFKKQTINSKISSRLDVLEGSIQKIHDNYVTSNKKDLEEEINTINENFNKIKKAQQIYKQRDMSSPVMRLDNLIDEINKEQKEFNNSSKPYELLEKLKKDFEACKENYLNLEIEPKQFKDKIIQTLTDNITEKKLAELNSNASGEVHSTTKFLSFISKIIYSIQDIFIPRVPRYRIQLFASEAENKIVKQAEELHQCLDLVVRQASEEKQNLSLSGKVS